MPSERRLHPVSFLFSIAGQLRELLLPGLIVILTAGSTGGRWDTWLILLIIPYAAFSLGRCLSYRYRFDDREMVVRTGFVFRNERRIPYSRIQNVDAVQRPLHRLLRVVEVHVQTGGGAEPEAIMRVLPLAALQEMRERVAFEKGQTPAVEQAGVPEARLLLELPAREIALRGFIENRGAVLIAAAFGVVWELGLIERLMELVFSDEAAGRGVVRRIAGALLGRGFPPLRHLVIAAVAFAVLLLVVRLVSVVESLVRLHGFKLTREGDALRAEYGLFTKVTATIPLQRIQLLTVTESPIHRWFSRLAVRVDTAGGNAQGDGAVRREALAPILRRADLPALLAEVLPGIDATAVRWQPAAPGAVRREFVQTAVVAGVVSAACILMLGVWSVVLLAALLALAAGYARRAVAAIGWGVRDSAVFYKSGWLWRHTSVAPFSRFQTVVLTQSPFDRRTRMARVAVDTAGAARGAHRVDIPYIDREIAGRLHRELAAEAARTTFRW